MTHQRQFQQQIYFQGRQPARGRTQVGAQVGGRISFVHEISRSSDVAFKHRAAEKGRRSSERAAVARCENMSLVRGILKGARVTFALFPFKSTWKKRMSLLSYHQPTFKVYRNTLRSSNRGSTHGCCDRRLAIQLILAVRRFYGNTTQMQRILLEDIPVTNIY